MDLRCLIAMLTAATACSAARAADVPAAVATPPAAQVVLIVPDAPVGVPWTAAIPDRPSTQRHAAEYLQLLLTAATGATPAIVPAAEAPSGGLRIYVGYGPHLDGKVTPPTPPEGLKIQSMDGALYLLGEIALPGVNNWRQPMDRGLVHAIETYAERVLGFRFLFATIDRETRTLTELGTVVPRIETFAIPDGLLIEDAPVFAHRVLSSSPRDLIGLRTGSAPAFFCNHSYHIEWWARQFGKSNPEMFIPRDSAVTDNGDAAAAAMASQPDLRFLDYTEPLLLETRLDHYEQFFQTGKAPGFHYMPNPKYLVEETIDTKAPTVRYNARSRALFDPDHHAWGNFSNIWFDYLNRMSAAAQQRWPDRNLRIATLAYMRHYGLPTFPLADNIDVMMAVMRTTMGCKEPEVFEKNLADVKAWHRHLGGDRSRLFLWEYGCWPAFWVTVPILTPNAHQRWLKAVQPYVSGAFVEMYEPNAYYFLMRYLWARMLWNPDLDVPAEIADACRHFFGPAGATMTDFHNLLIARGELPWEKPDLVWDQYYVNPQLHFGQSFTPDVVSDLARRLEQARRDVGLPPAFATVCDLPGSAVYVTNLDADAVPVRFSVQALNAPVVAPVVVWDGGRASWRETLAAGERLDLDGVGEARIAGSEGAVRAVETLREGDWPTLGAGAGGVFHFFQLGPSPAARFRVEVRYGAANAGALPDGEKGLYARRMDWLYADYAAVTRRQFAGATAGLLVDATRVHRILGKVPHYVAAAVPAAPASLDDEAWRVAPAAELVRDEHGIGIGIDGHGYPAGRRLRFQVLHAPEGLAFRFDAEGAPEAAETVQIVLDGTTFAFAPARHAEAPMVTAFEAAATRWRAVVLLRGDDSSRTPLRSDDAQRPVAFRLQVARVRGRLTDCWSPPVGRWDSGVQGPGTLMLGAGAEGAVQQEPRLESTARRVPVALQQVGR